MPDNETIPQRLHRRLAEAKARGASEAEIQQELAWAQEAINAKSAADPERQRTILDTIGAGAQTFADASTLGLSGLADDAITAAVGPSTFKGNREARKESKGQFAEEHPAVALGLEVGGALAMPTGGLGAAARGLKGARTLGEARQAANLARTGGAIIEAAPTAGKFKRFAAPIADAAMQSGVAGTVGNLDEASGEGVKRALGKGKNAAMLGGGIAGGIGGAAGLATRGLGRLRGMQNLEDAAFKIKDEMAKIDAVNYAIARGEAHSTLPIREVLESKTVKPFADIIRGSEKFQNADDATVLMETYKLMSQAQRKAEAAIEGSAEHQARHIVAKDDIGLAKGRMLEATEAPTTVVTPGRARMLPERHSGLPPEGVPDTQLAATPLLDRRVETRPAQQAEIGAGIPSLRKAVDEHRIKAGEFDRFTEGAEIGKTAGQAKSLPSTKIITNGRVAFLREIPKMTPQEAEAALAGVLGRTGEAARITNSPLGAFGLISSAVRLPMQMYRTGPIIEALEKQAGRKYSDRAMSDLVRGTLARTIGAEAGKQ